MREQNLIEATSDQQVSRLIQYLDPDIQEVKQTIRCHPDFEGLVTLVLLARLDSHRHRFCALSGRLQESRLIVCRFTSVSKQFPE